MRENNGSRPIAAAAVAEIPMTVRSSSCPEAARSCGAPMAFGCSRWTTAGVGYSPPSSIGTQSAGPDVRKRSGSLRPQRSRCGLRGCLPPPVRLGGWPCGEVEFFGKKFPVFSLFTANRELAQRQVRSRLPAAVEINLCPRNRVGATTGSPDCAHHHPPRRFLPTRPYRFDRFLFQYKLGDERSRGGVRFPTGGKCADAHKPASARGCGVSRFGETPKPTVIVRMEENGIAVGWASCLCQFFSRTPCSWSLTLKALP